MRKIVIAIMGTLSALVLVVSLDASRRGDDEVAAADQGSPDGGGSPSAGQSTASTQQGTSGTFLGDEVETRWGIVQVQITVKNGKITKSKAVRYPDENHKDEEINSWAVPQLNKMAVKQQGKVDSLSGATVTSDGYRESLQSAVDKANL